MLNLKIWRKKHKIKIFYLFIYVRIVVTDLLLHVLDPSRSKVQTNIYCLYLYITVAGISGFFINIATNMLWT